MAERPEKTPAVDGGYLIQGGRLHLKVDYSEVNPKLELRTSGRLDLGAKGALQTGARNSRSVASKRFFGK